MFGHRIMYLFYLSCVNILACVHSPPPLKKKKKKGREKLNLNLRITLRTSYFAKYIDLVILYNKFAQCDICESNLNGFLLLISIRYISRSSRLLGTPY